MSSPIKRACEGLQIRASVRASVRHSVRHSVRLIIHVQLSPIPPLIRPFYVHPPKKEGNDGVLPDSRKII